MFGKRGPLYRFSVWTLLLIFGSWSSLSSAWAFNATIGVVVASGRDEGQNLVSPEPDMAGNSSSGVERARAVLARLREMASRMEAASGPGIMAGADAPAFPALSPAIQEVNSAYESLRRQYVAIVDSGKELTEEQTGTIVEGREKLFQFMNRLPGLLDQRLEYLTYYGAPAKIQERALNNRIELEQRIRAFGAELLSEEKALLEGQATRETVLETFRSPGIAGNPSIIRNHRVSEKVQAPAVWEADSGEGKQEGGNLPASFVSSPGSGDTSANAEIRITPEIEALATSLGNHPVRILNWVRNNIEFVPYYGSLKGSEQTLLDRAGNDMDTSSLLIALLRASGIPARYVYGTVTIDYGLYRNLVRVETKDAVSAVIGTLAKPGGTLLLDQQTGLPSGVRIGHCWVMAWVPANYRGTGGGAASAWVQMDASVKPVSITSKASLTEFTSLNPETVGTQMMAAGVFDATTSRLLSFDNTFTENHGRALASDVDQFYARENAGNFFEQNQALYGGSEIQEKQYGVLPISLPFQVDQTGNTYSELPNSLRYRVTFNFYKEADPFDPFGEDEQIVRTYTAAELAARRLTVTYIPQSGADAMAMYAVNQPSPTITLPGGGTAEISRMALIPADAVEVLPMLRIDGEHQMLGPIHTMGEDSKLEIRIVGPEGTYNEVADFTIQSGGYHAIGIDFGGVRAELTNQKINALVDRLELFEQTVTQQGQGNPISSDQEIPYDDLIGEALHIAAVNYFVELNFKQDQWANSSNVLRVRNPSCGIVSQEMAVNETADFLGRITREILGSRMNLELDVPMEVQTLISRNRLLRNLQTNPIDGGTPLAPGEVMNEAGVTREEFLAGFSTGITASQTEHRVMERQLGKEASSAMEMVTKALLSGEPVTMLSKAQLCSEEDRQLSSGEIATLVRQKLAGLLAVTPDVETGIINAVNRGQIVFAPASPTVLAAQNDPDFVHYEGTGYIFVNPENASGGYIISGNAAGSAIFCGSETSDVAQLVACAKDQLGSIAPACCCEGLSGLSPTANSVQVAGAVDACAGCAANVATAFIDVSGVVGDAVTCLVAGIVGPALANLTAQMDMVLETYPNEGRGVQPSAELRRMADMISMTLIVLFGLFNNTTSAMLDKLGIGLPLPPGAPAVIGGYMAIMLAHTMTITMMLENPDFW